MNRASNPMKDGLRGALGMTAALASTLSAAEEAQLAQTIEMFEVITQSQPLDYQSLEILKEAYTKLGREAEALGTSKRIAKAYLDLGQLSSAILEYETILQRCPGDADVVTALQQIETQAVNFGTLPQGGEPAAGSNTGFSSRSAPAAEVEDGRRNLQKIFVENRLVRAEDFEMCWAAHQSASRGQPPGDPFIQVMSDRGIMPVEKSLKMLSDKSRVAFLSLATYDLDIELARSFPAEVCRRWCILPFDKMSKSVFVATANPYNQQAAIELSQATKSRLLWYLVPPVELVKTLRKVFR